MQNALILICAYLALLATVEALSTRNALLPQVDNLEAQLVETKLSFQVAIGDPKSPFQINSLGIELLEENGTVGSQRIKKQKAHEKSKLLLAQLHEEQPYFVNMLGKQVVELQNPGWRVIWDNKTPHGFLVCSFDVPSTLQRTSEGAVLEEGRFFLYHRMWSAKTLEYERYQRQNIQAEASKHRGDRDNLIKKLQEENSNFWTKLKTYGQAYKAATDLWESGWSGAKFTPMYDDQVLTISDECIVSTRGRAFRQAEWQKDFMVREDDAQFLGEDECQAMAYIGESRVDFLKAIDPSK